MGIIALAILSFKIPLNKTLAADGLLLSDLEDARITMPFYTGKNLARFIVRFNQTLEIEALFQGHDEMDDGTPRRLEQPIFLDNEHCMIHDGRTRVFIKGEQQRLTNRGEMIKAGKKYGFITSYDNIEESMEFSLLLANGGNYALPTLIITLKDITDTSISLSELENRCDNVFTIYRR